MNQYETMYRIFLTAYHIAKTSRLFSDLKELISLQVENYLDRLYFTIAFTMLQ